MKGKIVKLYGFCIECAVNLILIINTISHNNRKYGLGQSWEGVQGGNLVLVGGGLIYYWEGGQELLC